MGFDNKLNTLHKNAHLTIFRGCIIRGDLIRAQNPKNCTALFIGRW